MTVDVKTLIRTREPLVIATLPPGASRPPWAVGETFVAGIETKRETSIVCTAATVPLEVPTYGPYTAYELGTSVDPSLPGVLVALASGPARAGISLMPFATFDRGWVLVARADVATAEKLWIADGFTIVDQEEQL